jgi:hypothetical protein
MRMNALMAANAISSKLFASSANGRNLLTFSKTRSDLVIFHWLFFLVKV